MNAFQRLLPIALVLLCTIAPSSEAQTYPETYVEPWFQDCNGTPQTLRPQTYGSDGFTDPRSIDGDIYFEGASTGTPPNQTTEDNDGDPIFWHIQDAIDATDPGGVVHILTPGVYRENLTIDDSVTLRGTATGDVILEGACNGATPGIGIEITGSGKTVRLENLTIQGWDIGVQIASSDVAMTNCRVRNCENGIAGPAASANRLDFVRSEVRDCTEDCIFSDQANWRIEDSVIASCDYGLRLNGTGGTNIITVTRSSIFGHGVDGIIVNLSSSGSMLTLHDSSVTRNAGRGITYTAQNIGSVRITDSLVEGNTSDGVYIENTGGCVLTAAATLRCVITGSRILGNGGDGLELKGSGSSCGGGTSASIARVSLLGNTIAVNGAIGVNKGTGGTVDCGVGHNQIIYNVTDNENGTIACTDAGSTSSNAAP